MASRERSAITFPDLRVTATGLRRVVFPTDDNGITSGIQIRRESTRLETQTSFAVTFEVAIIPIGIVAYSFGFLEARVFPR
jgi:hypothetical protein